MIKMYGSFCSGFMKRVNLLRYGRNSSQISLLYLLAAIAGGGSAVLFKNLAPLV
jgi:hypothetical protein